ncbi:PREDICTED: uncharacterized protein LOC109187006 [Ipomoea nil]|uniref:uncharacterized protein LOC109187006 n=1 Tax=Ipomoea nil TaxID=35883 RepID=UPI000900ED20|nr:PREDICTED: uncharacterized protein LOC109187006 [Ipomoea nil]
MTSWPTVNINSIPTNNTAGTSATNPASKRVGNTALAGGSNLQEVNYDPQSQSNPYYLHINENPALELVSFPLDGSNYHAWARAMTMALSCKNKVAFINGVIKKPSQDDLERYYIWERCNNIRRFSQQDLFRVAEIMCEIYQKKQGDESLNEYFTKQKLLWDELIILKPPKICTCNKCDCGKKLDEIVEQGEKDKLSIFLMDYMRDTLLLGIRSC